MIRRRRQIQSVVLFAFVLICAGIFILLLHIAGGTNLAPKYKVEAVVPDVVQLVPGASVREAGVDVGTVSTIANQGDSAVVGLALNEKYAPLYRNATVRVATKTLVGENYIDLNPGDPSAGAVPAQGILPVSQARGGIQLDQILSVFSSRRQAQMRRLLAGFGGGLANTGPQLNETLDALSGTLNNAAPVAQALSDQSQQLASFVGDFGDVLNGLSQRSTQIHQFVTAGTAAAETVAARNRALEADLRALPLTISTAQRVTRHLASVGTNANPVLDNLGDALSDLTPALRTLPSASAVTLAALNKLRAVTPSASAMVTALKNTAPSISDFVPPLAGTVDQLHPLVSYLAPFTQSLDYMLYNMDSIGQTGDANGLLASLLPLFSTSTIQALPASEKALLSQVLGGASDVFQEKGYNNYPTPGTATDPQPLTTTYPRIQGDSGG